MFLLPIYVQKPLLRKRSIPMVKKKNYVRTSLAVQWLRLQVANAGAQVQPLVQGDSTCCRTTGPTLRNHWACAAELGAATPGPTHRNHWACTSELGAATPEPTHHNHWACARRACSLKEKSPKEKTTLQQRSPCSPQLCACTRQYRPSTVNKANK